LVKEAVSNHVVSCFQLCFDVTVSYKSFYMYGLRLNSSYEIHSFKVYLCLAISAYLTVIRATQKSPGVPLQKIIRRL